MQTHVVEGEEFVAQPEHRNVAAGNGHHLAAAGREITDAADDNELMLHSQRAMRTYFFSVNPAGIATDAASTSVVSFSISTEVVRMIAR